MGFWASLFRSSYVDNAAVNKDTLPGTLRYRDELNNPDFSEEYASESYADIGANTGNAAINDDTLPCKFRSGDELKDPGFSEEYASELYADIGANTDNSYLENGVALKETPNIFRLTYDGILAKDGAQDVYAVVGLEANGSWQNAKYYPMQRTDGQSYEVLFPARSPGRINVAFKDGADHWDNNSGRNYTYVNEGG